MAKVRLQMVAFGPFVPGIDEQQVMRRRIGRGSLLHLLLGISQRGFETHFIVVVNDNPISAAPWRVIPSNVDSWIAHAMGRSAICR